jgi:periplasmic divalent cation tolerance protein
MTPHALHITCPDVPTAERIADALLDARLIACAHVQAPHRARYWWKGRIEAAEEVVLLCKTRGELFGRAAEAARGLHPYEVPAIVGWPIRATEGYAAWIAAETAGVGG